jgi:phosphatidylethanolamine-binding protein (PEBP) family uncharacterized protein
MHPIEALLAPLGRAFRNRRSGDSTSITNAPELATAYHFAVTSPSFAQGEVIPAKHCGWLIGENVSPALNWGTLPIGTAELVLVFEDIDGPGADPRIHTIAEFVPTGDGIAEGALAPAAPGVSFARRNGKPGGYAGPRPLPGHGTHHYRFHLYAMDSSVDLGAIAAPAQLPLALAGHVLGSGLLIGTRTS